MTEIRKAKSTIIILLTLFFLFYTSFSLAETKDFTLDGNNFQVDLLENDNIKIDLNGDGDFGIDFSDLVYIMNNNGKSISLAPYSGISADFILRPSGSLNYRIKFTNKAGIYYNQDVLCYNTQSMCLGRYTGSTYYKLAKEENGIINKNEYFIVYKNGYSHILQFKNVRPGENLINIKDVGDGTLYPIVYNEANLQGTLNLDGNSYIITLNMDATSSVVSGVDFNGDGQISDSTSLLTNDNDATLSFDLSMPADFVLIPSGLNTKLIFTNKNGIEYNTEVLTWDGNVVEPGKNTGTEVHNLLMKESDEINEGDYFVLSKNGYSHIMEYSSLDDGILTLIDVGDSSSYEIEFTPPVQETCSDVIKNQNETDIDCGGVCSSCSNGEGCLINSDCVSDYCSSNICSTSVPVVSCTDGIKNQDETDVDCGGSCLNCDINNTCSTNNDCLSDYCTNNLCANITLPLNSTCGDNVCDESEDCCLDCGCDGGFGCQNNTCISLDECSFNIDCDDNYDCTSDICSGIPKQCSYSQNESCDTNETYQAVTQGEKTVTSSEKTISSSNELQSEEKGAITTEAKETETKKVASEEKAPEEPIETKQKNIFQRIIGWIINIFK